MTRQTSIDTFRQIKREGLLSRMRWRVYHFLYERGPLTGYEVDHGMAADGEARSSYHKRLPELQDLGVVAIVGKRACRVTGRMAITRDVTDQLPDPRGLRRRGWRRTAEGYRDVIVEQITYCAAAGFDEEVASLRSRLEAVDDESP